MKSTDVLHPCPFCVSHSLSSRLIRKWGDVQLISDASPVVFGHILLVSNSHHLSFGEMDIKTLSKVKNDILEISKPLTEIKPRVILFERGNKTVNKSGKISVDHAHFHLIPTEDIQLLLPSSKRKASFLDLPNYVNECSYYFYWDIFDDVAYWGDAKDVESQFIRKIVAEVNGSSEWDWKNSSPKNGYAEKHSKLIKTLLERSKDET